MSYKLDGEYCYGGIKFGGERYELFSFIYFKLVATLKVHTWHNMPFISGFGDLFLVTYMFVRIQTSIICWIVVLHSISGHSCKALVQTDLWIGLDYGCCIVLELVSLSKTQSSHNYLYKLRMNYRDILCIKLWTENQREQNLPMNAKWI